MNKLIFYFNDFIDSISRGVRYVTHPFEDKIKRGAILDSRLKNNNSSKFYKTKRK